MDYEKAYRDALSRAKDCHVNKKFSELDDNAQELCEYIFPELKVNDEMIRKELINFIEKEASSATLNANRLKFKSMLAWLEKQGEPSDKGEISDGFHTFNELYYYRMLYNAAFFNMLPKEWVHKSKKHNDGEECFGGGWFIVMANLPTGQISNHYELKDWDLFQIPEKERADKWDGHTPQEAAERLHNFLLEKQGEQNLIMAKSPQLGEQKPAKRSDKEFDDFFNLESVIDIVEMYGKGEVRLYGDDVTSELEWLKSLRDRLQPQPKQKWSEEDEDKLNLTISLLKDFQEVFKEDAESCIEWLKSFKPQSRWKPTDEQIHCFKCVIDFYKTKVNDAIVLNLLNSLYNNLLKL